MFRTIAELLHQIIDTMGKNQMTTDSKFYFKKGVFKPKLKMIAELYDRSSNFKLVFYQVLKFNLKTKTNFNCL